MNVIAKILIGGKVVKHKSVYALKRESDEIWTWFKEELDRHERLDQIYKSLFDRDDDALAKATSADLKIARADVDRVEKKYGRGVADAGLVSLCRLAEIMSEYAARTKANDEAAARSRRFNEAFAMPSAGQVS